MTAINEKLRVREFTSSDGVPHVRLEGVENFLVPQVFDCGQCFRFDPVDGDVNSFEGIAYGRYVRFTQVDASTVELTNATLADYEAIWKHYLALDEDYTAVRADIAARFELAAGGRDEVMPRAMEVGSGIRILRQEPWEAICSFIVSQNNNIPRIKKLIAAMSKKCGERIDFGGRVYYAFPTPESLVELGIDGLAQLKVGFRAKYIYDAALRMSEGRLDLSKIASASPEEAMKLLCEIKGVGSKVASCAMLFGFDRTDAFPVDVWIKRVLAKYYPSGLDIAALGRYAGIAQQYLFYYERYNV